MAGFGGVAEYGITVRWNKNFLKLVRLLLERRAGFAHFGGVRFGGAPRRSMRPGRWGSTTSRSAWAPASRPCSTSRTGWRAACAQASDFLMALQLTGAAKRSSIANLQIRLPVVVIGGGLTAIDTATESLAYYVRQVEKFAARYDMLAAERGAAAVRAGWGEEQAAIADEFLAHAAAIAAERAAAAAGGATAAPRCPAGRLGRRHHRLSPPADRQPVLHAEPRGSGQGDGGRRALRRGADPASPSRSIASATPRRCSCARADGAEAIAAGPRDPGGRRHPAQHRAGARGRPDPARRPLLPGGGRGRRPGDARCAASPSRTRPRC